MAVQTRQRVRAIGVPYETDPAKIADISSIGGAIKGLYGAGLGKVANTTVSAGRGIKNAVLDFTSVGSNADKPFYAHWDPGLDPANAAAAPATVQAQGPKKTAIPSVVSEAQAAEIPKPLANVVQTSAGTPPPSPAATSVPTAQPPKVQPIDGGSGYAVVDGKRINYRDIGASGDPLKKSGGYVITNGKGVPAIDAPADPNIGAMDREVKRIQGVQDDLNLSGIGVMSPAAARQSIAFRQGQQDLDQRGDMVSIAAQREANDADYQNKTLAINAPLIEAKTKKELSDAAVNQFAISPEGTKQAQAKEGAKDRKDLVNKYYDSFKNMSLPPGFEGKHMELAKKFAKAEDPDEDYGIYYNPGMPGNMGIGVKKSRFEPLLQEYRQAGYPEKQVHLYAMAKLKEIGAAEGKKLYEDIPALGKTTNRVTNPVESFSQ